MKAPTPKAWWAQFTVLICFSIGSCVITGLLIRRYTTVADMLTDENTMSWGQSCSRPVKFPPMSNERVWGPMMGPPSGFLFASASHSYKREKLCCASSPRLHLNRSSPARHVRVYMYTSYSRCHKYKGLYCEHILRTHVNSLYQTTPFNTLCLTLLSPTTMWSSRRPRLVHEKLGEKSL
jgi:hypothetical protein